MLRSLFLLIRMALISRWVWSSIEIILTEENWRNRKRIKTHFKNCPWKISYGCSSIRTRDSLSHYTDQSDNVSWKNNRYRLLESYKTHKCTVWGKCRFHVRPGVNVYPRVDFQNFSTVITTGLRTIYLNITTFTFCILQTEFIYVQHISLRINSSYFPTQQNRRLCNREAMFLSGINRFFKYNTDEFSSAKGVLKYNDFSLKTEAFTEFQ
jgi:hypothetical protein